MDCGIEIPKTTWKSALNYIVKYQQRDGSWGYVYGGEQDAAGYASLTCAGICSVALCWHGMGKKKPLKHTATFIIHGKDDMTVKVGGSRRAAKSLKSWKYPYRYDEINGFGHGIPHDKWMEAVEWLKDKRLHPQDAKDMPQFYMEYLIGAKSAKK